MLMIQSQLNTREKGQELSRYIVDDGIESVQKRNLFCISYVPRLFISYNQTSNQ